MMPAWLITLAETGPDAHVYNHAWWQIGGWWIWSSNMGNLLLSALILLFAGPWVASRIATGAATEGNDRYVTRNRFAHMIEVICVYLREETVRPLLLGRTERFMPILWTLFFYILVNNLLGLIPILDLHNLIVGSVAPDVVARHRAFIGGTLTQNLWVTGGLATVAFVVINAAGIRELGIVGYLHHLTGGAPKLLWPLMVLVEFMGTFIKPIALAIRLFANMTAGHILLAVLLGFIAFAIAVNRNIALGAAVTALSGVGAIAIMFLELFVAFLQAFVFMFLTTVFISLLSHHDEQHGHDHEHAHGAHPAHA